LFNPGAVGNPLKLPNDEEILSMISAAALADDPEQQEELRQEATARLDEEVLAVPIATVPTIQAISSDIVNVPETFVTLQMNPFSPNDGE
jgi:ABC-type transport system substrate-binding protein